MFFDKVSGYDTDIAVETIIDSVLVRTAAHLRAEGKKKLKQFEKQNSVATLLPPELNMQCVFDC